MHPILVNLYGLDIRSFGVMVVLAWCTGVLVSGRQAMAAGLDASMMSTCWFWGLIAAIIGARLPHLVSADIAAPTKLVQQIYQSRLSSLSGLSAAVVIALTILRVNRKNVLQYADAAVSGVLIFLSLCRLGCFLNGCCFGVATTFWWGCSFNADSPAGIFAASAGDVCLVPTQLFLALGNLGLFFIAVFLKTSSDADGTKCCALAAMYSGLRLTVGEWRVLSPAFAENAQSEQGRFVWILLAAVSLIALKLMNSGNLQPFRNRQF